MCFCCNLLPCSRNMPSLCWRCWYIPRQQRRQAPFSLMDRSISIIVSHLLSTFWRNPTSTGLSIYPQTWFGLRTWIAPLCDQGFSEHPMSARWIVRSCFCCCFLIFSTVCCCEPSKDFTPSSGFFVLLFLLALALDMLSNSLAFLKSS